MRKLEAFKALELLLRAKPDIKDRFPPSLKELGRQALEEQVEKYDLSEFILAR